MTQTRHRIPVPLPFEQTSERAGTIDHDAADTHDRLPDDWKVDAVWIAGEKLDLDGEAIDVVPGDGATTILYDGDIEPKENGLTPVCHITTTNDEEWNP